MSDEVRTILHTEYRYKPKGSADYVTHYFENSLEDVKVMPGDIPNMNDKTDLREIITYLLSAVQRLSSTQPMSYPSYHMEPDQILARGQIIYEIDTRKMKVGDGRTRYESLPYANSKDNTVFDLFGTWIWDNSVPDIALDVFNTSRDINTISIDVDDEKYVVNNLATVTPEGRGVFVREI